MSLKVVQRLLAAVVCCFVLATCYISIIIYDRQTALQKVSRYNAAWTVSQALAEFIRLEQTLATYAIPSSGTSLEDVQLRLDIMFSRIDTFEEGAGAEFGVGRSLRQFVKYEPANQRVIAEMRESLEAVDALIKAQGTGFDVLASLRTLKPLDAEMVAMTSRASEFGTARISEDRAELAHLHMLFTALACGLIVCGVSLIVLLLRQNRLLVNAHKRLSDTTAKLQETNGVVSLQNQRFDAALNNMSRALCTCDADGRLVVFNERFAELLGPNSRVRPGENLAELLADDELFEHAALQAIYKQQLYFIEQHQKGSFTIDLPDGQSFSVSHEPLEDGGWLATYENVSVRRQAEANILHMAHHDALTDLPNRVLLREQLRVRSQKSTSPDAIVAILLLDLDGFKEVNDTLGHHYGDEVLKMVADRLRACAPEAESVARLGGDEFSVLMPATFSVDEIADFAEGVLAVISEPYRVDGHEILLGASIGIAHDKHASYSPEEILKHADLAMYQAKADGRGRVGVFVPEMEARLHERKALQTDLREALGRGEMEIHYQPVLDTVSLQVAGFEALLRWKRRGSEYISPAEFIPLAEESGLIDELGEWILREACLQAKEWPQHLFVAVNLSPVQFRQNNVVMKVLKALSASNLLPQRLELEITESVLLEATEATLSTLNQLKDLGVRIALDDFGTGYSSLSYLSRFTFDKIKIDQSFVRELPSGGHAAAVVEMVADLGRRLRIKTTAEGVETEEQLRLLQEIGCSHVQGYLFAHARPPGDLQFVGYEPFRDTARQHG